MERGRHAGALVVLVVVALAAAPLAAQDKTLSEGHPVRLADAFPITTGEGAVLAAAGMSLQRDSPNHAFFPLTLQYGIFSRTQLSIGTDLSSHPHDVDDPRAGDLTANVRVNFGRETQVLPSFAALLGVTAPTGVDSRAFVLELKGYATKSVTNSLFLHVNAAADVADRVDADQRRARYLLALGPSATIPTWATVTVTGDVFAEQSRHRRESTTVGMEAGFRQRITGSIYWDAGVGSELAGPADRAPFFVTIGLTYGFGPFGGRR